MFWLAFVWVVLGVGVCWVRGRLRPGSGRVDGVMSSVCVCVVSLDSSC